MYEPIAIIGYGVLYPPNSDNVQNFWKNIKNGVQGIREVTNEVWNVNDYYNEDENVPDKTYCKNSAYLDNTGSLMDYISKFNLDDGKILSLNRTKKMVLYTILQAIDEANLNINELRDSSLIIGNMLGDLDISDYMLYKFGKNYLNEVEKSSLVQRGSLEKITDKFGSRLYEELDLEDRNIDGMFPSSLVTDITDFLGINQLSFVVDGACSGSLIAIDEAIKLLHNKVSKFAIVTGALGNMGVTGNVAFSKIGGLSHYIDDYTDFDFKLFKNYLSRNELKKINRIRILEKQYLKILSRFMIKNIVKNDFGSDELNCFEVLNNMGDIGQPVLFFKNKVTSMSVSMSYSSPLVAVEVYEKQEGGSIGIDIEKIFKNISSEFLEYCFTSKELESISKIFKQTTFECSCTMLWCIKESVGKLFSIGLSGNPKKIEILFKNLNELEVVIHSNKLGACVYREPLSLNVDFLDGYCICSAKIRGGIDNDINYISKKFKEDLSTKDSC